MDNYISFHSIENQSLKKVLIVQYSANRDGSAFSALLLAEGFLKKGWEVYVVFAFEGSIIPQFQEIGCQVNIVPHKNWLRRSQPLRFIKDVLVEVRNRKNFLALIQQFKPDIVYVNSVVSLAGVLSARKCGIPVVWHLRELFNDVGGEMHAPRMLRPIVGWTFKFFSTKLISNSSVVAYNLLRRKDGVSVIPNAVSQNFFLNPTTREEARESFDLNSSKKIIGLPGTLRPVKGHQFFFEGIAPLLRRKREVVVLVTGGQNSTYFEELKKLVFQLDIQQQVFFLGNIRKMPMFYRACDIVCIPSKSESFGRTVIEAFASKTPVVATAVGGIKETVQHAINGYLVDYLDEEKLRETMELLLDNQSIANRIAVNAYRDALEHYTASAYQEKIINLIGVIQKAF